MNSQRTKHVCLVNVSEYVFGAEKSMAYLAAILNNKAFRFSLVSPGGATELLFRSLGIQETYRLPFKRFSRTRHPLLLLILLFHWLKNNIRFLLICFAKKPDIIHANGLHSMMYVLAAGLLLRIPVVWHVRDTGGPAWCLKICAALSNVRIHPSKIALEEFPVRTGRSITVANPLFPPNSAPDKTLAPPLPHDALPFPIVGGECPLRIGLVGQMIPRKGHDILLVAFSLILAEVPHACLYFVGGDPFDRDSDYIRALKSTVQGSSVLQDSVFFLDYREDTERIYANLDVLAMPSREEPFGRVAVEAMAMGCPVVASNVGGLREVVRDRGNGLIFPSGNSEALAHCVLEMANDSTLRNTLIKNGLLTAEHYRVILPQIGKEMGSIYNHLSNGTWGTDKS